MGKTLKIQTRRRRRAFSSCHLAFWNTALRAAAKCGVHSGLSWATSTTRR